MSRADASNDLAEAAANAFDAPFGAIIELAPDGGASVWVDGASTAVKISTTKPKNKKPDCVWRGMKDVLLNALAGERALENAYVAGRLAVAGDMSVMARLKLKGTR